MANYRAIVELVLAGRSYGEVVDLVGCSRRDVSRVKQAITEHGVTSVAGVTDAELTEWFPDGRRRWVGELPDRVAADSIVNRLANHARTINLGQIDMRRLRHDHARADDTYWE